MATQPAPSNPTNSTQNSLLIAEIKDGVVVMRDGSMRAVVLSSAINFDLMSQREQDGVELSYQGFLNGLHFPIQILIKSQRIDLDNYVAKLQQLEQNQDNPLLADLMADYIGNIKSFVDEVNVMDKQFFVVVPYFPTLNVTKGNIATSIMSAFRPIGTITLEAGQFDQAKTELRQRVQQVAAGLTQMGLRAIPLNTQELIDLYYASYNPDVAQNQKLIDAAQLQTATVTKGVGRTEPPMAGGV